MSINDRVYGKEHTEWNHVVKARPLYRGHRQPVYPGELGFYDLRLAEARAAQAQLAEEHGVTAFCYWTYWSRGQRMMNRPLDEMVASGAPDLSFCLGWANHPWYDTTGRSKRPTFLQGYGGQDDYVRFFRVMEGALHDERYFQVHGKPLVYIFRPFDIPDLETFCNVWRSCAEKSGLKGVYLVGQSRNEGGSGRSGGASSPLDAMVQPQGAPPYGTRSIWRRGVDRLRGGPVRFRYADLLKGDIRMVPWAKQSFPCVITNWDRTPRWGRSGSVLIDPEPRVLEALVRKAKSLVAERHPEERLVFLKSWNEWGEGNYLEPDEIWGRGGLEAVAAGLTS